MQHTLQLSPEDTDVNLVLPNGEEVIVQFRVKSISLDICLPHNLITYTWLGDDLQPSEEAHVSQSHVRFTKQLCVILPENTINQKED